MRRETFAFVNIMVKELFDQVFVYFVLIIQKISKLTIIMTSCTSKQKDKGDTTRKETLEKFGEMEKHRST